jgi:DNA invertase Pin-like site-specific DNA recombinase
MEKVNRETPPVVFGYCRVSTEEQDLQRQKLEILEYANKHGWTVEEFIKVKVGSSKTEAQRGIDKLREAAAAGKVDIIVFSELSRFGRSVGEISRLVESFVNEYGVELHFIKENMQLRKGPRDIQSKVTLTMFSLLAEIERDLISERTKSALAARKAAGVILGRPKMRSKLDIKTDDIRGMIAMSIKQKAIAKQIGCTEATLSKWLKHKRKKWMVDDSNKE